MFFFTSQPHFCDFFVGVPADTVKNTTNTKKDFKIILEKKLISVLVKLQSLTHFFNFFYEIIELILLKFEPTTETPDNCFKTLKFDELCTFSAETIYFSRRLNNNYETIKSINIYLAKISIFR